MTEYYGILNQYLREGDKDRAEQARDWRVAIGLQAVDGLKPSDYLLETARRNVEGEIGMEEVGRLLHQYYESKAARTPEDEGREECDKASANIKRILATRTLAFNTNGYIATHRRIFEGVFKHAGELRKYDMTKKEFVLRGDTVNYLNWEDLRRAIDYDLQQEREFSYKGLTDTEKIQRLCRFTAGLWQIHAFREGNTRTTAVFLIQYLRSIGYKDAGNDMFADHSWYFRNALVRANYKNTLLGIDYDFSFLERFFRNLLLGENHELKNRTMVINAPEGWGSTQEMAVSTQEMPVSTQEMPASTQETKGGTPETTAERILEAIRRKPTTTRRELAEVAGITPDGIKKQLDKLRKAGIIRHEGPTKGGRWRIID